MTISSFKDIPRKPNWLKPLISPIVENHRIVTEPFIDGIEANTLEFENKNILPKVGGFDWSLTWKEFPLKRPKSDIRPYTNIIMCGGLFAISAKYFKELEYYDDGLKIWGGENLELSFKIWMCGGNLLRVPCSRIAHLYKAKGIYKMIFY